ncbi:12689_t:CDS:2, partial [Dentiscutata erythropus]
MGKQQKTKKARLSTTIDKENKGKVFHFVENEGSRKNSNSLNSHREIAQNPNLKASKNLEPKNIKTSWVNQLESKTKDMEDTTMGEDQNTPCITSFDTTNQINSKLKEQHVSQVNNMSKKEHMCHTDAQELGNTDLSPPINAQATTTKSQKEKPTNHKVTSTGLNFSPNNPYVKEAMENTIMKTPPKSTEITEDLTSKNENMASQNMEIELSTEKLVKSTVVTSETSEIEFISSPKKSSLTQQNLQDLPFTVVSYRKPNSKKGPCRCFLGHLWTTKPILSENQPQ